MRLAGGSSFDSYLPPEEVIESGEPIAPKRARRVAGGRSDKERKRMQRQRDKWRQELRELTDDERLVASVCDQTSYVHALQAAARQEGRREDDEVEYRIRLALGRWLNRLLARNRRLRSGELSRNVSRKSSGAAMVLVPGPGQKNGRLHENRAVCESVEIIRNS